MKSPGGQRLRSQADCFAPSCKRIAAIDDLLDDDPGTETALTPITPQTSSAEVARRALAACVARLVRALARVLVDEDAEWIHQARSAGRALRANLAAFAPLLDREEAAQLDARLRALGHSLGGVRDNDVLIEHIIVLAQRLPDVGESSLDGLVAQCRAAREYSYAKLTSELQNDAYPQLLEDLVRAVCRDSPLIVYPQALSRETLVRSVIERPWRRLERAVDSCGDDPTPAQLHSVRIKAKRCRYAVEAVAPLVRASRADTAQQFLRRLTRLQDTLGSFQDAVSESERLRALTSSKLDRFVAGEVAELEARVAAKALASWRKAWKRASRRELRFWRSA